jgi:HSP20 family protein
MLQRSLWNWGSSWREMERLRREMNRLFERSYPGTYSAAGYPAMNVWTSADGAIVTAELPGVDPADIDISVVQDTLTIKGCQNPEPTEEGVTYHRRERSCGRFSRSFQLSFPVDTAHVEAAFENGVLNINLPRAEEAKPKKIAVKAS